MTLKQPQKQFLEENPFVGVVTTLREDGSPHSTVVWVDMDNGKPSFNTASGRAKPTHLEHDPRPPCSSSIPTTRTSGWPSAGGRR